MQTVMQTKAFVGQPLAIRLRAAKVLSQYSMH